jgi:hypothetical protein
MVWAALAWVSWAWPRLAWAKPRHLADPALGALLQGHHALMLSLHAVVGAFVGGRLWWRARQGDDEEGAQGGLLVGLLYVAASAGVGELVWRLWDARDTAQSGQALVASFLLGTLAGGLGAWALWRKLSPRG